VLTGTELDRIKKQVIPEPVSNAHKEKAFLKTLSDERASHWPNTISAMREKKERDRRMRLEKEEEEKRAVDAVEAELKAEQRQLQIERANKMLYDETDKVKAFHSSLLLSDVLAEREKQIEYARSRVDIKKKHEAAFVQKQKEALEIAEAAEQRKFEERRTRALLERDAQLEQLEDLRTRILEDKEINRLEGLQLKAKAQEEVRIQQQKDDDRRERAREANMATIKANEALRQFREVEKQKEREQDIKIAEFAKQKERMIVTRKKKEEEKQAEKQANRDRMVALMEQNLLEMRQDAEARLKTQEEEARIAEDTREAERAEARRLENLAIDASRNQQLNIRAVRRAMAKKEEEEFVAQWKVRTEQIKKEEEMERVALFERNKRLQAAHLVQMDRKLKKAEVAKRAEMEDALATRLVVQEDEELFKHYTSVCIEEWKAQGKNLTPMMLEISKKEKLGK